MILTDQQVQQLQQLTDQLETDQAADDQAASDLATAQSNVTTANAALVTAQSNATAADTAVQNDVQALQSFLNGLFPPASSNPSAVANPFAAKK